ncbi:hypothetical protein, partial [Candidatus Vampirococcus lugosii]
MKKIFLFVIGLFLYLGFSFAECPETNISGFGDLPKSRPEDINKTWTSYHKLEKEIQNGNIERKYSCRATLSPMNDWKLEEQIIECNNGYTLSPSFDACIALPGDDTNYSCSQGTNIDGYVIDRVILPEYVRTLVKKFEVKGGTIIKTKVFQCTKDGQLKRASNEKIKFEFDFGYTISDDGFSFVTNIEDGCGPTSIDGYGLNSHDIGSNQGVSKNYNVPNGSVFTATKIVDKSNNPEVRLTYKKQDFVCNNGEFTKIGEERIHESCDFGYIFDNDLKSCVVCDEKVHGYCPGKGETTTNDGSWNKKDSGNENDIENVSPPRNCRIKSSSKILFDDDSVRTEEDCILRCDEVYNLSNKNWDSYTDISCEFNLRDILKTYTNNNNQGNDGNNSNGGNNGNNSNLGDSNLGDKLSNLRKELNSKVGNLSESNKLVYNAFVEEELSKQNGKLKNEGIEGLLKKLEGLSEIKKAAKDFSYWNILEPILINYEIMVLETINEKGGGKSTSPDGGITGNKKDKKNTNKKDTTGVNCIWQASGTVTSGPPHDSCECGEVQGYYECKPKSNGNGEDKKDVNKRNKKEKVNLEVQKKSTTYKGGATHHNWNIKYDPNNKTITVDGDWKNVQNSFKVNSGKYSPVTLKLGHEKTFTRKGTIVQGNSAGAEEYESRFQIVFKSNGKVDIGHC